MEPPPQWFVVLWVDIWQTFSKFPRGFVCSIFFSTLQSFGSLRTWELLGFFETKTTTRGSVLVGDFHDWIRPVQNARLRQKTVNTCNLLLEESLLGGLFFLALWRGLCDTLIRAWCHVWVVSRILLGDAQRTKIAGGFPEKSYILFVVNHKVILWGGKAQKIDIIHENPRCSTLTWVGISATQISKKEKLSEMLGKSFWNKKHPAECRKNRHNLVFWPFFDQVLAVTWLM